MKKFLALLMVMLMCFGLLCACGEPTEEGNEGAPGTDSAKELISQVHYTYTREKNGETEEEEVVINIQWTENGAIVEGYQDGEEGRSEMRQELTLDELKRPLTMTQTNTHSDGEMEQATVAFAYEKEHQIKQTATYSDGGTRVATFDFDENGHLIREDHVSYVNSYEYDAQGNCVRQLTEYTDGRSSRETKRVFTYDETGKLIFSVETNSDNNTEKQTHYYYYPNGNVMMEMRVNGTGDVNFNSFSHNVKDVVFYMFGGYASAVHGMEYEVEKDDRGYIVKVTGTSKYSDNSEKKTATFEYDEKGNLVKHTNFYNTVEQWEYDNQNRLVKHTNGSGATMTTTVYEYDDQGRLISEKRTDADGTTDTFTRAYNEVGMTTKMTMKESYIDGDGAMIQYVYTIEVAYIENANCTINGEWAGFVLTRLLDIT